VSFNDEAVSLQQQCKFRQMSYNAAMKLAITIERDEDGAWISECPSIPGCISQGSTRDEAIENICDAIKLCLAVRTEQELPLTVNA
jgi:predicted RNase H-like HicB family nuclease